MANLKSHPGLWLRDDAAAAINAMEDKHGVIVINSAGRTVEEQKDLIRRYDAGDPNVYMPARPPETSTHVRNGGEAVDVYNYRDDRAKLEEFGFEWFGPRDPVHYTFVGRPSGGYFRDGTLQGLPWTGVQRMLKADYGYTGRIDNAPGAGSVSAFQRFMNAKGYGSRAGVGTLRVDGEDGPATLKAAQQWLKERWGYTGAIDAIRGGGTNAAWARANEANGRAYAGVS